MTRRPIQGCLLAEPDGRTDGPASAPQPHAPSGARVLCIGGEDHALRIPFLHALGARGLRVIAACPTGGETFARERLAHRPFRFDRFVSPWADWTAIGSLAQLITDVRPDIIQTFDTKPGLLAPLAARRVGNALVVRTINGMGRLYSSRSPTVLAMRLAYSALHRLAAGSNAVTVFQNREDQHHFERHGMARRNASRLIPGSGIDIEGFENARARGPSATSLREALGLGATEVVITVTRLTRQKGIATLLEAAALVRRERPGVRFLLVGPRESEGPLAVSQAELDRHVPYVRALGPRTDVPSLLGLADVFAFPTEYREGVPRALLEAGLAGLPIVATRMPGCSDVVRDGQTGLLVPPHSPRALAAAILRLLRERQEAQAMGSQAAALVRREFGLELTADRYAALYAGVLAGRRAAPRPPQHLAGATEVRG